MARDKHFEKWVGSDGKRYVTDDPEVIRRREIAKARFDTNEHKMIDRVTGEARGFQPQN